MASSLTASRRRRRAKRNEPDPADVYRGQMEHLDRTRPGRQVKLVIGLLDFVREVSETFAAEHGDMGCRGCGHCVFFADAALLLALSAVPAIWLPKTAGGHTRQYFPVHDAGMVKNSGSAVFDTFATVRKDQPLVFHWPRVELDTQSRADLKLILRGLTYFGRAESWCRAELHGEEPQNLSDVVTDGRAQTHWCCVCIEAGGKPVGREYRDYTLERRLAPCGDVHSEVVVLLPRTKPIATDTRPKSEDDFRVMLTTERAEVSLLRCLLRESGQDIKDGLERPIGTRRVQYAVPRAISDVPRLPPKPRPRDPEAVDLVVFALNTATVHRPVLPP